MRTVRVDFADGNHLETSINGTDEEIRDYYVGTAFNFGDTDQHPADRMVEAVKVTFRDAPSQRLDYLRGEIQAERISYGEIAELQSLAAHIPADDLDLRAWL